MGRAWGEHGDILRIGPRAARLDIVVLLFPSPGDKRDTIALNPTGPTEPGNRNYTKWNDRMQKASKSKVLNRQSEYESYKNLTMPDVLSIFVVGLCLYINYIIY